MFSKTSEKCVKKLDPVNFFKLLDYHDKQLQKNTEVKLELLIDINMLLMVEKRIRGGTCDAIHRYAKVNNEYMRD